MTHTPTIWLETLAVNTQAQPDTERRRRKSRRAALHGGRNAHFKWGVS